MRLSEVAWFNLVARCGVPHNLIRTCMYMCVCVQGGGGGAACQNAACSFGCTPTQTGPVCECPEGFQRIGQGSVAQLLTVCLCVRFSGF